MTCTMLSIDFIILCRWLVLSYVYQNVRYFNSWHAQWRLCYVQLNLIREFRCLLRLNACDKKNSISYIIIIILHWLQRLCWSRRGKVFFNTYTTNTLTQNQSWASEHLLPSRSEYDYLQFLNSWTSNCETHIQILVPILRSQLLLANIVPWQNKKVNPIHVIFRYLLDVNSTLPKF